MIEALELMEYAEAIGHGFSLDGEQLRIKRGKHLQGELRRRIIQNKPQIVVVLEQDQQARQSDFIVGIPGTLYFRSVSKRSAVYIECVDGQWEARRETYQKGKRQAVSIKTIVEAATFDYALDKAVSYFMHLERHMR